MKVLIVANEAQEEEIKSKNTSLDAELVFVQRFSENEHYNTYDAIFYLHENHPIEAIKFVEKPVFINCVIETLAQKETPQNFSRINGWPGFLQIPTWEVVSNNPVMDTKVFDSLYWNIVFVKDEPGLVAARVISMIINEAFFALEDGISTIDEIDLAMKLGTNYPYGPFEWKDKIGLQNIYHLLNRLSLKDKRYSVSPLLEKKYFEYVSSQKIQ